MFHEVFPVGPLACNCSILGDPEDGTAIVVDPGDNIDRILKTLEDRQLKLRAIVVTHAHIDHIGGAAKLKAATGAPVYLREEDKFLYDNLEWQAQWLGMATPQLTDIDVSPREGDTIEAGVISLQWIHTPGHTPGLSCLYLPAENKLLAGDTLFLGSVGRTDLPGGNHRQLLQSIHGKLLPLPGHTLVTPGHGPETTLAQEREHNPFLVNL